VCDNCGAVCALPSMAYQRVDVGGRTETWLLCTQCRTEPAPEAAPVPLAVQVAVQVNAAAIGTGLASDGPLAMTLPPAAAPPGDGATYSYGAAGMPYQWPADAETAHRWARTMSAGGRPYTVTAYPPAGGPGTTVCAYLNGEEFRPTASQAAAWDSEADLRRQDDIRQGRVAFPPGRPAAAGPAQPGQPLAAPGPDAAVTDIPLGELAAGDSPTETSTDGGHVSTELELADGGGRLPARAGEAYNYGAWAQATASDAELLEQLGLCVEAMLSDLTAVSAGRTQVQNVTAWADRVRAEADLTRDAIDEMDRRYKPVIATVAAVGGPDEVSNSSYYRET